MPIKRYKADADNVILNALEALDSNNRVTGSNVGAADILEVYSIYNRKLISGIPSTELARSLIKFPMADIISDRNAGVLPESGSVTFRLKLSNAKHSFSLPYNYTLEVKPVSASWEEGEGLDLEAYTDKTNDDLGSNWIMRNSTPISEITKVTFNDATKDNYASGEDSDSYGTTYLTIYNEQSAFNFYFSSSAPSAIPNAATGDNVEVDITSAASTAQGVAGAFQAVVDGLSDFSANIDGAVVYVTASNPSAPKEHSLTASSGVWSSISLAVQQSGSYATPWNNIGGDFHSSPSYSQYFSSGTEDLDIDISGIVEEWIAGTKQNYGLAIKLPTNLEPYFSSSTGQDTATVPHNTSGVKTSHYAKMFFGRGTEFFFRQPVIEAQYEDITRDDRGKFAISSSLLQDFSENLNKLYFFNYHAGQLKDIANNVGMVPTASFYYSSGSVPEGDAQGFLNSSGTAVTSLAATRNGTGSYYVQLAVTSSVVNSTYPYLVDVWSYGGEEVLTGSAFKPIAYKPSNTPVRKDYVIAMPNLLPEYKKGNIARFRLYVREKKWSPNIYSVAKSTPENYNIVSGSYRVLRESDEFEVISYGTGSVKCTALSYDSAGNYFDLDTDLFEPGYQYMLKFAFYDDYTKSYIEQPSHFKFRVIE